jgi:hypothetical protein
MIVLSQMFPARARQSHRRYFKGSSYFGTFWLLESEPGRWTLKLDPKVDVSSPFSHATELRRADSAPALTISETERTS